MNRFVVRSIAVVLLASCALGLGPAACKKQSLVVSETSLAVKSLPEATNVMAAMDQKKYDDAVAALIGLRQTLTTEDQQSAYGTIMMDVKTKLMDLAPTDPKAAEALSALRMSTLGR